MPPIFDVQGSFGAVESLDWSKENDHVFLSACSLGALTLWDMRSPGKGLFTIPQNGAENRKKRRQPIQARFTPYTSSVIYSTIDRSVNVWDLNRQKVDDEGREIIREQCMYDGEHEYLCFAHRGHLTEKDKDHVTAVDCSPEKPWCFASAGEDKTIQVWQINNQLKPLYEST